MYHPGPKYPHNWNKKRYAIFAKYNYICQLCGNYSKGNLQLHHIQPINCGGSEHPNNEIPLCTECHKYVHSKGYSGPLLKLRRK